MTAINFRIVFVDCRLRLPSKMTSRQPRTDSTIASQSLTDANARRATSRYIESRCGLCVRTASKVGRSMFSETKK